MGCTHTADCPLFPKLNATLYTWRESYCDTEAEWKSCARFKRSAAGQRVPLALLPNGYLARALQATPAKPQPKETAVRVGGAATATATATDATGASASAKQHRGFWARLFGRRRNATVRDARHEVSA